MNLLKLAHTYSMEKQAAVTGPDPTLGEKKKKFKRNECYPYDAPFNNPTVSAHQLKKK